MRRDEPTASRLIWAFVGILVVIGGFWVLTSDRFAPADGGPSAEVTDIGPQTLSQMTSLGEPGVLEFYTADCPWCAKLEPELAKLDKQYGDKLFVVKMNAEKYPSEAGKYRVQAVPTLVYFDETGAVKAVVPGYITMAQMVAKVKELGLLE
jgi:thioredoxin-like negative regulator of GroEL